MMRSLSSAVAGLRTHQTKMDVIGNNIANVNTYGFKASRASFSDVYYQTLAGAGSAQSTLGGTNPTQIGYGASVATIDMLITQSGMASTDRALDVYIDGDGFLISQDATGKKQYSRLGVLYFDAAGNLVDGNGQYILGFPMITDPDTGEVRADIPSNGKADSSELVPIKISPPGSMTIEEFFDSLTGISISNSGQIVGIQNGDTEVVLAAGLPSWVNRDSITISPTSTYVGGIRVAISGLPTAAAMSAAIGGGFTVDKVDFGTIALDADDADGYTVTVNQSTNTVTITRPATTTSPAVNISGTLKDGKIVLKNSNGDVGMTLYTSATSLPDSTTTTSITTYPTVSGGGNLAVSGNMTPTAAAIASSLGLSSTDIFSITGTLPADTYTVSVAGNQLSLTGAKGAVYTGTVDPSSNVLTLIDGTNELKIVLNPSTFVYPELTGTPQPQSGYPGNAGFPAVLGLDVSAGGSVFGISSTLGELTSGGWWDASYSAVVDPITGEIELTIDDTINNVTKVFTGFYTPDTTQGDYELILSDGSTETFTIRVRRASMLYPAATEGPPLVGGTAPTQDELLTALGLTSADVDTITGNLPAEDFTVSVSGQTVTLTGSGGTVFQGTVVDGELVLSDGTPANDITIQLAGTDVITTSPSTTSQLSMGLFQQMTTLDLGGNTVRVPADPEPFTMPSGTPPSVQFGDFSFTISGPPTTSLNAIIATGGPGEGKRINIGNLAVAKFRNTGGLQQAGSSYFEETVNSGNPVCALPGLEGTGGLVAGYLEMSNVDISKEFTDMITTQRGFQANTRIVTVSDEMLQELVNLKR